jgi:DNA-binding response OmpR family regulator
MSSVAKADTGSRVLVVDDDELVRTLLLELLSNDGYRVDQASTAEDAIRLLLRHWYSLLITDLEMPETSGLELIKEVRARGLRLPVLAVSGAPESMREAAILNLGLAEVLSIPFAIGEVREAVARLLAQAEEENSDTPTPRRYSPD